MLVQRSHQAMSERIQIAVFIYHAALLYVMWCFLLICVYHKKYFKRSGKDIVKLAPEDEQSVTRENVNKNFDWLN